MHSHVHCHAATTKLEEKESPRVRILFLELGPVCVELKLHAIGVSFCVGIPLRLFAMSFFCF